IFRAVKYMKKSILAAYDMPPPPPGTPKASSSKKIIAIVVIAVVIVAVIVGAYVLMNQNPNPNNNTSPTPTSGTSPTPTATGSSSGNMFEGASSLKFSVTITSEESGNEPMTLTYYAKNIGTQQMMLRVDMTEGSETGSYIVNGVTKQYWINDGIEWTEWSEFFEEYWTESQANWAEMENDISEWGGEGTYTDPLSGVTVTVHDVQINPNLPDTLFAP
ncbi:MAG: hypothetical protein QM398_00875, partial [Thermoproteota archaeon]|nr:hypothetical protein [Thermoproteota archaeon]